jgi:hypothetical protein
MHVDHRCAVCWSACPATPTLVPGRAVHTFGARVPSPCPPRYSCPYMYTSVHEYLCRHLPHQLTRGADSTAGNGNGRRGMSVWQEGVLDGGHLEAESGKRGLGQRRTSIDPFLSRAAPHRAAPGCICLLRNLRTPAQTSQAAPAFGILTCFSISAPSRKYRLASSPPRLLAPCRPAAPRASAA